MEIKIRVPRRLLNGALSWVNKVRSLIDKAPLGEFPPFEVGQHCYPDDYMPISDALNFEGVEHDYDEMGSVSIETKFTLPNGLEGTMVTLPYDDVTREFDDYINDRLGEFEYVVEDSTITIVAE